MAQTKAMYRVIFPKIQKKTKKKKESVWGIVVNFKKVMTNVSKDGHYRPHLFIDTRKVGAASHVFSHVFLPQKYLL